MELNTLSLALCTNFPKADIVGLCREVLAKEAVVYVNSKNKPAAVDDRVDATIFWVANNAEKLGEGFGKRNAHRYSVSYTLAISSKKNIHGMLISIINSFGKDWEYTGSNFDTQTVAQSFFGLTDVNHQNYFFTMNFNVIQLIESVECLPC